MQREISLYIQSNINDTTSFQKVDLYKDEVISLTMTIQDVKDIEKVRTDFTQPFTVPASSTNNQLFKHYYNPDIQGYNANFRHPAILEINSLPFRNGFVTLNNVKMKDGAAEFYNITFLGETVDLKNIIGDDQLDTLNWLDQNASYPNTFAAVRAGLTQGRDITVDGVTYADAIVYPLLTHSVDLNFSSTPSGNSTNFTNLWAGSSQQTQTGLFFNDLKPGMRIDFILRAIEIKYDITFSNDFFGTAATENLYLWLHRQKGFLQGGGVLNNNNVTNITCTNQINFPSTQFPNNADCIFFSGGYSPLAFSDPCFTGGNYAYNFEMLFGNMDFEIGFGNFYPDNAANKRQFKLEYTFTPSGTNKKYNIAIRDNYNDVTMASANNVTGAQTFTVIRGNVGGFPFNPASNEIVGNYYFANIGWNIESEEYNTFDIQIIARYYGPYMDVFQQFNQCVDQIFRNEFRAIYTASNIPVTVQIVPSLHLPELKVLDFLTGLFKMFNLTATFNSITKVTEVKTLDDFYSEGRGAAAGTNSWDLTEYIIADTHDVNEQLPFSEIKYEYEPHKTILAQKFEQSNNRQFGAVRYSADASKGKRYQVKAPFEHMLYQRLNDLNTGNQTTIQTGTFLDDNLNASFGKPLVFYGVRVTSGTSINMLTGQRPEKVTEQPTASSRSVIQNYFIPHNANEITTQGVAPANNINYGGEINSYSLEDYGANSNSLFNKYWTNYIVRVMDNRNRLFIYKAQLPLDFLLNFGLNDKVVVGNREFTINKIQANLITGEATLELLNIF